MGPKNPIKAASFLVLVCGSSDRNAKMYGRRRRARIRTPSMIKWENEIVSFSQNRFHGQTTPYHMKIATLRRVSIVGCSRLYICQQPQLIRAADIKQKGHALILSFQSKPVVPSEDIACNEASENVIATDKAAGP